MWNNTPPPPSILNDGSPLIETIEVSGSDTGEITFSSLNGDSDEIYYWLMEWKYPVDATTGWVIIKPNGLTTNQQGSIAEAASTPPASGGATGALIAGASALDAVVAGGFGYTTAMFWGWLHGKTGFPRLSACVGGSSNRNATLNIAQIAGIWNETSTNITSLTFATTDSSLTPITGFAVGSRISLYKLSR